MGATQPEGAFLELDDTLEKVTFYCLGEARGKLDAGEECAPFTVVVDGEQMFVEAYPDMDVESCRANAQSNVKTASSFASHYAFCYDGFLVTDNGQVDAIIVECAHRDMPEAYAIALPYHSADGGLAYAEQPALVDRIDSFFDAAAVKVAEEAEKAASDERAELERAAQGFENGR